MANDKSRYEMDLGDIISGKDLTKDMEIISNNRHKLLLPDNSVDIDKFIEFLTEFNEFINHEPKPFKPMRDKVMKI